MTLKIKYNPKPFKKTRKKIDIEYDVSPDTIKTRSRNKLSKEITIKPKKHTFMALILRKNGSAVFCYIPVSCKSFSVEGNTYFNVKSGSYIVSKSSIITVYLEGCVMPIEHRYLTYIKHNVLLMDNVGLPVKDINADLKIPKEEILRLPKNNAGEYYKNSKGFIIKKVLNRIKGLEFDSVIANAIYNSGLIEKVSHGGKPNKYLFPIFIMLIISIVIGFISIGVRFI